MKIVKTCENTAGKVARARHLEIGSYWFLEGMKRLGQFRTVAEPGGRGGAKTLSGADLSHQYAPITGVTNEQSLQFHSIPFIEFHFLSLHLISFSFA